MCALRILSFIIAGLLLSSTLAAEPQWKLVWSDEFDKDGLPDPAKWDYEEGFVRNNEAQYYTRARKENARVEKGMLVIEGRKEKFENPRYNANATRASGRQQFAEYTSAALVTKGKADWTYGRIEVRAKLPQGLGVWPAIWMLGTRGGWPAGGEIDIMEFVGHSPDLVHATVHFSRNGKHASSGSKLKVAKPFDDFHVYAVEWSADHMDFYFDQQKYHTFPLSQADNNGENPFRKPQYLLINLALGGSWGGKIDPSIFPQKFLVDYVRVYQAEGQGK
jgi:beta-glucanase (GH16 family)